MWKWAFKSLIDYVPGGNVAEVFSALLLLHKCQTIMVKLSPRDISLSRKCGSTISFFKVGWWEIATGWFDKYNRFSKAEFTEIINLEYLRSSMKQRRKIRKGWKPKFYVNDVMHRNTRTPIHYTITYYIHFGKRHWFTHLLAATFHYTIQRARASAESVYLILIPK